ncbi:hypothetical protein L0U88_04410 [Flavihumibacter sp. RY-1]|uniref:Outer membrane beta-barrel porin/alpha-amylase n=1 Tax=Flavihumibacter fluminis TaxID=2909236 RepID=A0ABS9BFK6_9BACT|nr:DUF6733 family protein [Flavihumibacter fluminis]MCF1713872.1 hypothetical protein [Flavihumibacter fluminis]
MRKVFSILSLFACLSISTVNAQTEDTKENKVSIGLSLNHDAFFGFNPMLSGAIKTGDKSALTFYGIQWGAGTAIAWGNWTEFGLGYSFQAGESVTINPQIGVTMGNLLSSFTAGKYAFGDGIVPNLTVNLNNSKLEGQFYAGYYAALRKEGPLTANYVHYWLNFGGKLSSHFSVGAHFENLFRQGGKNQATTTSQYYTWLGPYIQFTKGIAGLRFSAGGNLAGESARANFDGDFYKMNFFLNF